MIRSVSLLRLATRTNLPWLYHRCIFAHRSFSASQHLTNHNKSETILRDGYSLLNGEPQKDPSWNAEARRSLEQLATVPRAASVDLSLLLVEHLVRNSPETLFQNEHEEECIWDSLVYHWHTVSKVEKCISPEKLLPLLDGWTTELRKINPDLIVVNWKALSFMIANCQKRSKKMIPADLYPLAEFSERLLMRMVEESSIPPSTGNLNAVISIWAKLKDSNRTRNLLKLSKRWGVKPDQWTYNYILHSLTDDPEEAEAVLYEFHQNHSVVLPTSAWNIVLNAWAKQQNIRRMEQLLNSMQARPDLITYNTTLFAWARAGETNACEQLLAEMHRAHASGQLDAPPDLFTYSTLLNAYATSGKALEAEALVNELYTEYAQNGREDLKPKLQNYTSVLKAYMKYIQIAVREKNTDDALWGLARARIMMDRMNGLHNFGAMRDPPDAWAFEMMLQCYYSAVPVAPVAEAAEEVLREMLSRPNVAQSKFTPYSIVIQTWMQQGGDGLHRAAKLFDEAWGNQQVRANMDTLSLHCILVGFARAEQPGIATNMLVRWCKEVEANRMTAFPRVSTFGSLIGAWRRSPSKRAPVLADDVFMHLETLQKKNRVSGKVDRELYEGILSCWSFGDTTRHAEKAYFYLSRMHQLAEQGDKSMFPTAESYQRAIDACSRGEAAPLIAEEILCEMIKHSDRGARSLTPNAIAFNSVLCAWRKSCRQDAAKRAFALFEEMEQRRLKPDIITYKSVLACLTLGRRKSDAQRAEWILRKTLGGTMSLRDYDVVSLYGSVLTAWCRTYDRVKAHEILMELCNKFLNGEIATKPWGWQFKIAIKCLRRDMDSSSDTRLAEVESARDQIYPDSASSDSGTPPIENRRVGTAS